MDPSVIREHINWLQNTLGLTGTALMERIAQDEAAYGLTRDQTTAALGYNPVQQISSSLANNTAGYAVQPDPSVAPAPAPTPQAPVAAPAPVAQPYNTFTTVDVNQLNNYGQTYTERENLYNELMSAARQGFGTTVGDGSETPNYTTTRSKEAILADVARLYSPDAASGVDSMMQMRDGRITNISDFERNLTKIYKQDVQQFENNLVTAWKEGADISSALQGVGKSNDKDASDLFLRLGGIKNEGYTDKRSNGIIHSNPSSKQGNYRFDPHFGSQYFAELLLPAFKNAGISEQQARQYAGEYLINSLGKDNIGTIFSYKDNNKGGEFLSGLAQNVFDKSGIQLDTQSRENLNKELTGMGNQISEALFVDNPSGGVVKRFGGLAADLATSPVGQFMAMVFTGGFGGDSILQDAVYNKLTPTLGKVGAMAAAQGVEGAVLAGVNGGNPLTGAIGSIAGGFISPIAGQAGNAVTGVTGNQNLGNITKNIVGQVGGKTTTALLDGTSVKRAVEEGVKKGTIKSLSDVNKFVRDLPTPDFIKNIDPSNWLSGINLSGLNFDFGGNFNFPNVNLPNINFPNVNFPNINFPDISNPFQGIDFNVNIPDINFGFEGGFDLPEFELPDFNIPDFDLPDFNLPDFNLPKIDLPDFNLPDLPNSPKLPNFNLPEFGDFKMGDFINGLFNGQNIGTLINLLGTEDQIKRIRELGGQGNTAFSNIANQTGEGAKFTPFNVASGTGNASFNNGQLTLSMSPEAGAIARRSADLSLAALNPYQNQQVANIGNQAFNQASGMLGQSAQVDPLIQSLGRGYGNAAQGMLGSLGQSTQSVANDLYNQQNAMLAPQRERESLALENRLRAQGRLGMKTAAYGGSPEQFAQQKAYAEQDAANRYNSLMQAEQMAGAQQQRALGLGSQAGQMLQLGQGLQAGNLQLGQGMFGLGQSAALLPEQINTGRVGQASNLLNMGMAPTSQLLGQASLGGQLGTNQSQVQTDLNKLRAQYQGQGAQFPLQAESLASALRGQQIQAIANAFSGGNQAASQADQANSLAGMFGDAVNFLGSGVQNAVNYLGDAFIRSNYSNSQLQNPYNDPNWWI